MCSKTSQADSLVIYSNAVMGMTKDQRPRQAVTDEKPLQRVEAINVYHTRLAEASGYKSLYVSESSAGTIVHGLIIPWSGVRIPVRPPTSGTGF